MLEHISVIFSTLWLNKISLCGYTSLFIHSSGDGRLGSFHLVATVTSYMPLSFPFLQFHVLIKIKLSCEFQVNSDLPQLSLAQSPHLFLTSFITSIPKVANCHHMAESH